MLSVSLLHLLKSFCGKTGITGTVVRKKGANIKNKHIRMKEKTGYVKQTAHSAICVHVSLHVEARFCLHRCVSKVGWQKNNNLLLFMDPLLPSIFRKSVRLITPHIPIPIPIMYWGISVPDPSNIMHIIRILWSVSDKEITLARWATTNCHWASVFGKWDLPFFFTL